MSKKKFSRQKRLMDWRQDNQNKYDLYDIKIRNEESDRIKDAETKKYGDVSKIIANGLLKKADIPVINYVSFYPIVEQIINSSEVLSKRGYSQEDIEKITLRVLRRYNVLIRREENEK